MPSGGQFFSFIFFSEYSPELNVQVHILCKLLRVQMLHCIHFAWGCAGNPVSDYIRTIHQDYFLGKIMFFVYECL